jgi:hypothetical protein
MAIHDNSINVRLRSEICEANRSIGRIDSIVMPQTNVIASAHTYVSVFKDEFSKILERGCTECKG